MTIGIKYCGGCNSVYNRGRQTQLLKEQFPEHEFRTAAAGTVCDVWLIVCGCMRSCASTDGLTAKKRMFILPTERSFEEVRTYLRAERGAAKKGGRDEAMGEEASSADRKNGRKTVLRVGQSAQMEKTFFKDDIDKFAALTGDFSRLHTDAAFAEKSDFGRPVVHGMLTASLISSVMGMQLPGEGTVFTEAQTRFLKPVFYGDTITARVRFLSCREGKTGYIGTFSGVCTNQNGEMTVAARCRQLMSKELFEVVNPGETKADPDTDEYWG